MVVLGIGNPYGHDGFADVGDFPVYPVYIPDGEKYEKGYIGALTAGILGGVFSSPCATPVLVALLGIVAQSGNVAWGILLLLLYSIGHGVLVLVAGTSIGFVRKITKSGQYGRFSSALKIITGTAILVIALYMFYLSF